MIIPTLQMKHLRFRQAIKTSFHATIMGHYAGDRGMERIFLKISSIKSDTETYTKRSHTSVASSDNILQYFVNIDHNPKYH